MSLRPLSAVISLTALALLTSAGASGSPATTSDSASAVATGLGHTCALTTGGGVKCWGYNSLGQLGDGTTTDRQTPVDVSGLSSGVTAVAAGGNHTCALTTAGGVKCWGENSSGELGDGTTTNRSTPVDVSGLSSGVAAISTGYGHTCALTTGGGVKCWGYNSLGQLGDGTTTDRQTPVDVSGLSSGVTAVAAGGEHTCALTTAGGAKCWGSDSYGELGDGVSGTNRLVPVDVSGLSSGVAAISTGTHHTCVAMASGGAKCWGYNGYGQLGDGTTSTRLTPVDVFGLGSGVAGIAAGHYHTCAVISGGVQCWGSNFYGELGDGTTADRLAPVSASGLSGGMSAVAAGGMGGPWRGGHTCALSSGGELQCWGHNNWGQLGDGTTTERYIPMDVLGFDRPKTLTIAKAGGGAGSVTSSPAGIDCGSTCSYDFPYMTSVTLTATPQAGSTLTGWSDCGGQGACTVTVRTNQSVTVTFVPTKILTVSKRGTGSGLVSSRPPALHCGSTCSHAFPYGTSVDLYATPAASSRFTGWSGGCSGTGSCSLSMTAGRKVTAGFKLLHKTLRIVRVGSGTGTVTSKPSGIDCGRTCSRDFVKASSVELAAAPAAGSTFSGWFGDCSGTGRCKVSMTASRSALATFTAFCLVPNVRGKLLRLAEAAILNRHCSIGRVKEAYSTKVAKGRVLSQKPAPGRHRPARSRINLVVSKGKRP